MLESAGTYERLERAHRLHRQIKFVGDIGQCGAFCKRFGDARLGWREAEQPHEMVVADIRTIVGIDNCENGFRHLKHIGM